MDYMIGIFSENSVDRFARRGTIMALIASIDFHIWSFTSKNGIDDYKTFISLLKDKGRMKTETVDLLADGWEERSVQLQSAAVRWERLVEGQLSNNGIHEYFARSP
jgi:hypothetical protein